MFMHVSSSEYMRIFVASSWRRSCLAEKSYSRGYTNCLQIDLDLHNNLVALCKYSKQSWAAALRVLQGYFATKNYFSLLVASWKVSLWQIENSFSKKPSCHLPRAISRGLHSQGQHPSRIPTSQTTAETRLPKPLAKSLSPPPNIHINECVRQDDTKNSISQSHTRPRQGLKAFTNLCKDQLHNFELI